MLPSFRTLQPDGRAHCSALQAATPFLLCGKFFYCLACRVCLPGLEQSPIRTGAQSLDCVVANRINILRELECQGQWKMDGFRKARHFCFQFSVVLFGQAGQPPLLVQIAEEFSCFNCGAGCGIFRLEIFCQRGCALLRAPAKPQHDHNTQCTSAAAVRGSAFRPLWIIHGSIKCDSAGL